MHPDEIYNRPIDPEKFGVSSFPTEAPGRSELHVSIPHELEGNADLLHKLDASLNDQGIIIKTDGKRSYWRSSKSKEKTAAKIIRAFLEKESAK